ncbi:hypothetical protein N0V84_011131 [Fusarium piperis]|uniref:Peptidase S8/S53 domain-containing protein n=1 Tax=Fusarium piperis TaxID=1435070 RepID=A0A9W8W399_9HYPO|nr:hypothetical protein N0V84_011131 [Fusarium piperis]
MSSDNPVSIRGIEHTVEWMLVERLREASDLFSPPEVIGNTRCSNRTLKLRNAINDLELQIRRTFMILRFDLLLHLQNETRSYAPKPRIHKDFCQDNSDEDTDDASSQSSTEPHIEDWPSHDSSGPAQPSVEKARSRLEQLCEFLEARVNLNSSPPGARDNRATKYPRLTRLMERVALLHDSFASLDLIPTARPTPTPFLFNIAEDEATAKAFVAFASPGKSKLSKEIRNKMIKDATEMAQFFLSFNSFVDALQMSAGSLDVLAWEPTTKRLASDESFASFSLLRKFQHQTEAACRAVLSHIGSCTHPKHEVLLQLPGWEDVSNWDSTKATANLPVPLFFTMCLLDKKQSLQMKTENGLLDRWQHARMFFLRPENAGIYKEKKLCEALSFSHQRGMDLEFYVSEHSKPAIPTTIPIHIPSRLHRTRRYGKSFPSHSLWSLIDQGRLGKEPSFKRWFNTSRVGGNIGIQERKALAIKLVLGLMLSLDSDHVFETWDPKQVRLLESLVLLAKALLEIAEGDHLNHLGVDQDSSAVSWDALNRLRDSIEGYIREATCGAEINREILPFLHAALGCLDFHTEYQSRLMESQSSQKMEVAWQVVYDIILAKIDSNLTAEGIIAPSSPVLAQDPTLNHSPFSRNEVSQQAISIDGALQGFSRAATFTDSCARFVTHRNTDSGDENPRRIRIAVIDTGVDFGHAGIGDAKEKGRIKEEWCHSWVGADARDEDDELHGTNCAYLLHKSAPEADIYVAKVFNQNAVRFYEAQNVAKAIEHAVMKWEVDIISMSFGLTRPAARDDGDEAKEQSALERYLNIVDEIDAAIRKASPRLMFAAASNSGKNEPRAFPASDNPYVFCVHASTGNGHDGGINPETGSDFNFMTLGMGLDLLERENFTKNGRSRARYKKVVKSGTSFATPIAAGIAATVLDLAARTSAIDKWTRDNLKRFDGMEKMLRLMSTPKGNVNDRMCYMAPWQHWESGWEREEALRTRVWNEINVKVSQH